MTLFTQLASTYTRRWSTAAAEEASAEAEEAEALTDSEEAEASAEAEEAEALADSEEAEEAEALADSLEPEALEEAADVPEAHDARSIMAANAIATRAAYLPSFLVTEPFMVVSFGRRSSCCGRFSLASAARQSLRRQKNMVVVSERFERQSVAAFALFR